MAVISEVWTWVRGKKAYTARQYGAEFYRAGFVKANVPAEIFLREAEKSREAEWNRDSARLAGSLQRRTLVAAQHLRKSPGGTVLELGAGSGQWTHQLSAAVGGENPITAGVFNDDLFRRALARRLLNTRFVQIRDLENQFPPQSFDHIVATNILTESACPQTLASIHEWLKPGGQVLLFVQNPSNPMTRVMKFARSMFKSHPWNSVNRASSGWLAEEAMRLGFSQVEITPWEVTRPRRATESHLKALLLENAPFVRHFARALCFQAVKTADTTESAAAQPDMAIHPQLFGQVSVVVPCHNEEANVERLVAALFGTYNRYIREIILVDDNSSDKTAEIAEALTQSEPRVRLIKRNPPCGVGRALRDGYAAAAGRYILTMDCDFIHVAPELKPMFDAVAEGCDGAIGSRFSSESVLIRYPFLKIVCNRGFHIIMNLLLGKRLRDISNNLKLCRADILKNLDIEENHFAANVETGLKPVLQGYSIREIPTSWINRTEGMGKSSFSILKVAPDYFFVLLRIALRVWQGRYRTSP